MDFETLDRGYYKHWSVQRFQQQKNDEGVKCHTDIDALAVETAITMTALAKAARKSIFFYYTTFFVQHIICFISYYDYKSTHS